MKSINAKTAKLLALSLALVLAAMISIASSVSHSTQAHPVAVDIPVAAKGVQTAVFAGGCFWGIEAVFEHVKGVTDATSGYSGGEAKTAHYEMVSRGNTGHAEAVKVTFDPTQVSYEQLLQVFFSVAHDPTELNRQGPDSGTQYRSAIFYVNEEQRRAAQSYIEQLKEGKRLSQPVVTQVVALKAFYPAESYHQNYAEQHEEEAYIVVNDLPKVENLRREFPKLYVATKPASKSAR